MKADLGLQKWILESNNFQHEEYFPGHQMVRCSGIAITYSLGLKHEILTTRISVNIIASNGG